MKRISCHLVTVKILVRFLIRFHCVKSFQIQIFSSPHFSSMKALRIKNERWFLFHFNKVFVLQKNNLIEKIWNFQNLFLRFMTSHSGQQAITIHILSNISRSKGKLTMKFGQLIEYNKRNIFLQKLHRKWARETSSKSFFFKRTLYEVKTSGLQLSFNIFR